MVNHVMRYYTDKGKHSKQNRIIARRKIDMRIKKRDKTRLSGTFLLSSNYTRMRAKMMVFTRGRGRWYN